ncbi:unnamed protein product [Echinostoma caproni]|uniref:Claudin-like protein n=1 Tax=Echinostoma caproni TaxID=27848 RepID=A0A183AKI3_9TREM|nr:unnamed protein product [Echinostoma caproni]
MRLGRAVWLTCSSAGLAFALFFLFLCVIAMCRNEWSEFVVSYQLIQPSYTYVTRSRGLWRECSNTVSGNYVGYCADTFLWGDRSQYNKGIEPILIMRMTTGLLQLTVSCATLLTMIIAGAILADVSRRPYKWGHRSGQYTVIVAGALMWFFATAYFVSILLHYGAMDAENYRYDSNYINTRSAWTTDLRQATFYQPGSMLILVYAADILLYLSSACFLLTASLHKPPIIERSPIKIVPIA